MENYWKLLQDKFRLHPRTLSSPTESDNSPLQGVIGHDVLANPSDYQSRFTTAPLFNHIVIDNFFESDILNRMIEDFPEPPEIDSLVNEYGGNSRTHSRADVRNIGGVYNLLDGTLASRSFAQLMSEITGIDNLLHDPEYFEGGTQNKFEGQETSPHVDFNYHPVTGYHRRINAIVYLNHEWEQSWGGALDLHKSPWDTENDEVISMLPGFGTCVIFETSDHCWHAFDKISLPPNLMDLSRKSFAFYMYTQTRPADQIHPRHGTFFVQKGLEPHIQSGYTLNETDVDVINNNLHNRNLYLKFLYQRETEFINTVSLLNRRITVLQNHYRIPVCGYIKQIALDPIPYPDGWIDKEIHLEFRALMEINTIELRTVIPDEKVFAQKIYVVVDKNEFVFTQNERVNTSSFKLNFQIKKDTTFTLSIISSLSLSPIDYDLSADRRNLSFKIDDLTFR